MSTNNCQHTIMHQHPIKCFAHVRHYFLLFRWWFFSSPFSSLISLYYRFVKISVLLQPNGQHVAILALGISDYIFYLTKFSLRLRERSDSRNIPTRSDQFSKWWRTAQSFFSLYSWSSSSSSLHFIIRTYHDKTCVESPLRILMDISHGSISNGCFFFFALDGLWYRSRSLRSHCTGWERKPICVIGCWCDMHKFMFISPKCKAAALYRYI